MMVLLEVSPFKYAYYFDILDIYVRFQKIHHGKLTSETQRHGGGWFVHSIFRPVERDFSGEPVNHAPFMFQGCVAK